MTVYKYVLELREPAIINSRPVRTGYEVSKAWIQGSAIRGAILTSMLQQGLTEKVRKEEEKPGLKVSPAYLKTGGGEAFPAHPYMYKTDKRSPEVYEPRDWLNMLTEAGSLERLLAFFKLVKERRGVLPYPVKGSMVVVEDAGRDPAVFRIKNVKVGFYASVGISKKLRKGEYGLLYHYQAVAEGTVYWGVLADLNGVLEEKKYEVFVGRGVSRGFGGAVLRLEEMGDEESVTEKLWNGLTKGRTVLYALSPVAYYMPLDRVGFIPDDLQVARLDGRPLIFGDVETYVSWYRRTVNVTGLRPLLKALSPGSIIVAEKIPERLRRNLFNEPFQALGLNFLLPLHTPLADLAVRGL